MKQSSAILRVCLLIFSIASMRAAAPDDARAQYEEKIQKLEARVAVLESMVAKLIDRSGAPAASAPAVAERSRQAPGNDSAGPSLQPGRFEMPPELIPEIGKIGAQIGLTLSGSTNPFQLNSGTYAGGFIDLPLFDKPDWLHGKISYEISVGLSQSNTTFSTTSNVAQVANLAVLSALNPTGGLANVTAAVTGTGPAPFPVTSSTQTRLRLLEVVPFSLKYNTTVLDRWRLRPYAVLGFGTFVTIHNQNPALGTTPNNGVRQDATLPPDILAVVNQLFGGKAPFGGPLVAGQISQSPELEARGLPGGHGNIDIGIHGGAGVEFRVSRSLSLGFDARFNKIAGTYGIFNTYGTRIGFHF
jgi:hypothetical protein